ncbi:MAG TPA: hypothetical protein VKY74_21525 [Chloroflexia bacterium]|nr:hypothetical protein [Chloroflexia bacterium]
MPVLDEIGSLLSQLGNNVTSPTAYDTAWVAVLRSSEADSATPLFPECLEWISTHQHPDGSWGALWPYYHDKLLSTLRAILTLQSWGRRTADRRRIERGLAYIWQHASRLPQDHLETVGFELIFPTLLDEAEKQGLALPYAIFQSIHQLRDEKLAKASLDLAYQRLVPLVVNLEALGGHFKQQQAQGTQEQMGAVGMSPAATAYLLSHWTDNSDAAEYLHQAHQSIAGGGIPPYFPLETFERSWGLYFLHYAYPDLYSAFAKESRSLLEFLHTTQIPAGWTATMRSSIKESDSTGVCFAVLSRAGYQLDEQLLYQYAEPGVDHFRCYRYERNPSITANAHILDALRYCDPHRREPYVARILRFLAASRELGGYWLDKWHVSPYYPTCQVVLAAYDVAPQLLEPAIDWIVHTQHVGGGWGYYSPTMEETAYAILALAVWREAGHSVPDEGLARAADYVRQNFSPTTLNYPPLWVHKTLYTPVQIVQAAVLAALLICETRL